MAEFFDQITEAQTRFIEAQPMFFIATAPPKGRISLSPKGMDTFRVISPNLVAYLDLVGSGAETAAHIKHDGRVTVMFNSFGPKPLILRLYGHGRVAAMGSNLFNETIGQFPEMPGARQIIFIDVGSVQTSCGYAVPQMELVEERQTLLKYADKLGPQGVTEAINTKNQSSIDGLDTGVTMPAIDA